MHIGKLDIKYENPHLVPGRREHLPNKAHHLGRTSNKITYLKRMGAQPYVIGMLDAIIVGRIHQKIVGKNAVSPHIRVRAAVFGIQLDRVNAFLHIAMAAQHIKNRTVLPDSLEGSLVLLQILDNCRIARHNKGVIFNRLKLKVQLLVNFIQKQNTRRDRLVDDLLIGNVIACNAQQCNQKTGNENK
ncbi:hypothetical protein D3C78_934420 [compost metagenome]